MTQPKHRFSPAVRELGLFEEVQSIQDLENRISQKWNTVDNYAYRGYAWEVFVEAYLNVIRKSKEVYPASDIPQKLRNEFNLTGKDIGVDGLFFDENGKWASYQAKYRDGKKNLLLDDLATFYAASESIPNRYVICNSYDLGENAKNQKRVWTIRHNDFKQLTPQDFKNICEWIKSQPVIYQKKFSKPHQEEAIQNNVEGFKKFNRGQNILACASGKTLIALWTAERLEAIDIVVFVPSLFLIAQLYREWKPELGNHLQDAGFVFVCSQVDKDEVNVNIPITTDPQELKSILKSLQGKPRIVISTYQSSEVVSEATKDWLTFDFGFFDEAHKTAGKKGSYFSLPLFNENISITKRLFATATPRHVTGKNKEGNFNLVSMDDENIYGPIFNRLTFTEAIKRDIICDYKIVAVTITSDDVDRELLKQGETQVKRTNVRTLQVAHQLALSQAYKKYNLGKSITYCSTINQAKSFTSDNDEGVISHIPHLDFYGHVSSQQTPTDREMNMESFGQSKYGIMSNARCLTEGVDIPSVDCVYFTNPRRSRIDNTQACGRAMRKSNGKQFGYIIVPIFVNLKNGENIEEVVKNTKFDALADIMLSMRELDEDIVDKVKYIGQQIGEGKKVKGFIGRTIGKVEFIGPSVPIELLESRIETEIVDRLVESWDIMYGKLLAFKEKCGHCDVSSRDNDNKELGNWVCHQRQNYKVNKLSDNRINLLNEIGFAWSIIEDWNISYDNLVAFKDKYGHCDVLCDNKELRSWVNTQRNYHKNKNLSEDRINLLNKIGFTWSVKKDWHISYNNLVAFKKKHRHCDVPRDNKELKELITWMDNQRTYYKNKHRKLSDDKINLLNKIGFIWNPREERWNIKYGNLVAFKKKHRHCDVLQTNKELGSWVGTQRAYYKNKNLSENKINLLNKIGFTGI